MTKKDNDKDKDKDNDKDKYIYRSTFKERSQRLVTFAKFDQGDEET